MACAGGSAGNDWRVRADPDDQLAVASGAAVDRAYSRRCVDEPEFGQRLSGAPVPDPSDCWRCSDEGPRRLKDWLRRGGAIGTRSSFPSPRSPRRQRAPRSGIGP